MELFERLSLFDGVEKSNILITGAAKAYKIAYAVNKVQKNSSKVFFVCENDYEAKKYHTLFSKIMPEDKLFVFSKKPLYFTYADSVSRTIDDERIRTIASLFNNESGIIVTSIWALCETMPFFTKDDVISKSVGDKIDLEDFTQVLVNYGYTREYRTESAGQFSVRGGVIDFYPAGAVYPYRLELFGDEIDSVRFFDPQTQLSVKNADKFELIPYTDVILSKQQFSSALKRFIAEAEKVLSKLNDEEYVSNAHELIGKFKDNPVQAASYIHAYSNAPKASMADLASEAFFILCEPASLKKGYDSSKRMVHENHLMLSEKALAFPGQLKAFADYKNVIEKINENHFAALCAVEQPVERLNINLSVNVACADFDGFGGNVNYLLKTFAEYNKSDYKIIITYSDEERKKSLKSFFENISVDVSEDFNKSDVVLMRSDFCFGMDLAYKKALVIPDTYIITKAKARKSKPLSKKLTEAFFTDIKPGDYVVHDFHGIGVYEGVIQIKTQGIIKDYIKIIYANEDALYVPPEQMDLVQKYYSSNDSAPKISRLGGSEWVNTKKKVSKRLKELAEEYVQMYARRKSANGFSFSKDTSWQAEFEEKFMYEPTPDQLKASEEIKQDMQSAYPMDRLLCADVGYGKTEVAARAAFKAVNDSKQTAILVPTTILAAQHYNSFEQRFKGYPIRIEMLSRFVAPSKVKKIKQDLKNGSVDIVIGTQKLLAGDIAFKDLGLLIVDEEQRFGVAQKDKLKLLKENVDTLSLSATPIPRTLHMSLSGIKDMSVIQTPPANRSPVQTYVMRYDEIIVKEAIQNELARQGQVFYVHNSTKTIQARCDRLRQLVPDAKIEFAHGQMKENDLEKVVMKFINHEFDVLVCTTIIENGIDIINANTIIVENADKLGLSQLYQLRGRVGRSDTLAYAYMMYHPDNVLSEVSAKRLQAIKQFTKFGSGFKIALRDLQIRGSGNIIGSAQHGNFGNVGYEMYIRLLNQVISEQKGETATDCKESEIDINIDAYIPSDYIQSEEERIEAYKRISFVDSRKMADEVIADLTDMYSDPPQSVINLINTAYVKSLAQKIGVKRLTGHKDTIRLEFYDDVSFDVNFINSLSHDYTFKLKSYLSGTVMIFKKNEKNMFMYISDLLELLLENKSVL